GRGCTARPVPRPLSWLEHRPCAAPRHTAQEAADVHAVLTREGRVLDEEATEKVRRKALSASTAKSLANNCAASFAFSKLAGEKRADPFAATDQGTAAHAVLEELYKLAPSKRTERRAINILLALQERWQKGTKKEPPLYPELGNPVTRAKFQSEVIEKYSGIFTIENQIGRAHV